MGSLWNELVLECREISSVETKSFPSVLIYGQCVWALLILRSKDEPSAETLYRHGICWNKYTNKAFLEMARGYLVYWWWTASVVKWGFLIVLLTEFFKWTVSLRLFFKMRLMCKKGSKAYKNDWGFSGHKFYLKTVISNHMSVFENFTLQAQNEILWLHLRTVAYFWLIWH